MKNGQQISYNIIYYNIEYVAVLILSHVVAFVCAGASAMDEEAAAAVFAVAWYPAEEASASEEEAAAAVSASAAAKTYNTHWKRQVVRGACGAQTSKNC